MLILSEPADQSRTMGLVAAAVLLVLLAVVLTFLVRAIKGAKQQQAKAESTSTTQRKANPAVNPVLNPQDEGHVDLTQMKAFSADMLPKLSFDEPGENEDAPIVEDSLPKLTFEADAELAAASTGDKDLVVITAAGASDRGLRRTRNEDAMLLDPRLDLFIVADGMGGYAGGDVAANTAVAEVRGAVTAGNGKAGAEDWPPIGRELVAAIEKANATVHDIGGKSRGLEGMGTTILTARFTKREPRMYIAYVGDSRLYRLRNGTLRQLTVDHTLGNRGVTGPLAATVRRAVGVESRVKVDVLVDKPAPQDVYVMCSDGLYKMVPEDQMKSMIAAKPLGKMSQKDLKDLCDSMIKAANAAGGKDNITVVLVQVGAA